MERLNEMLNESEESRKALTRQQLELEEDIEIKSNSLLIDRDQNMTLRKQINYVKH